MRIDRFFPQRSRFKRPHDIDLFVQPEHARLFLQALAEAGFDTSEYDPDGPEHVIDGPYVPGTGRPPIAAHWRR